MKSLTLAFLLLGSLTTFAEDMQAYLRKTQSLAQHSQHQQALERMIWFHGNALREDPTIYSTRLSVALGGWARLASFYAPAKTALVRTRDRDEIQIVERGGSRQQFADLVAIDRALGKPEHSLEVFNKLHTAHPKRAEQYWPLIRDLALEEGELILASTYITDVMSEFEPLRKNYERRLKSSSKPPGTKSAMQLAREERFVAETRPLIELAVSIGDAEDAIQIQKQALELVEDPKQKMILTAGLPEISAPLPPAEDPPLREE